MGYVKLEVWAFPFDHEPVPLPDLRGWKVSPTDGDWGSISFDYPTAGRGYEWLDVLADDDVDLRVEVTVTDADGGRWVKPGLLLDHDGDDVVEQEIVTVTGVFHEYELSEARFPYAPGSENGETVAAGTPGRIVREWLQAAQGRGALQGITWTFTDSHDSTGRPWSQVGSLRFSPGQHYAAGLGTLTGYGLSEWELTNSRELRLYDGEDGKGVDRTVGPNPLTLEHGRDLADAPRKRSVRNAITALISAGKDGLYSEAVDATAQARRRRRIEGFYSFGNAAEQGSLDALTQARLGTQTAGQLALSHKLVLGPDRPTPLIDYEPSDWLYSAARRGPTRQRVKLITLEGSGDEVATASVALNSLTAERAVKQQAALDALTSGAATVGTSLPPPDVDPGTTPDTPDDLVANSLWYSTGEGVGLASITAAWTAVPDATVTGYVVEWRYLDTAYGPTSWQRLPPTDAPTLTWSAVAPGAPVEVRVSAANKWDRSSPPSAPFTLTTQVNSTPPPVASAATPYAAMGLVFVPWDGRGAAGEAMPGNFEVTEIHVSTTSGATPHRPVDGAGKVNLAASTTYVGELRGAGEYPVDVGVAGYGTTYYVRLVTRGRDGLAAAASAQASVVARAVQDNEVAELSIGKLRTGILTALLTISGIIRTATAGARVELDTTGLRCISSTGAILFEFHIPTSILTLVGKLISGQGVGVGSTIVIDPGPPPRILFYPTATQQRFSMPADSSLRPDGTTGAALTLESLTAAGQTSGFSLMSWATNVWIGHKTTAGAWQGAIIKLEQLGQAILGNNNAYVAVGPDSIDFFANGEIDFDKPPGGGNGFSFKAQGGNSGGYRAVTGGLAYLSFVENASNVRVKLGDSGGAYKNFVIPHPVDPDRWLVHACTEAPEAQVEYRGVAVIVDGRAVVELPDYFEAATRAEGRTVHLTMLLPDEPLDREVPGAPVLPPAPPLVWSEPVPVTIPESAQVHTAAASRPRAGRFRIASTAPDGTEVAWLVKAVRADGPPLDVEPLRTDVDVRGAGPYRTITAREQEAA